MLRRTRIRIQRRLRKLFVRYEPPERLARGLAAGFFVAAIPLPGLQIPLSVLAAFMVRGNKAIAILPQFISNAVTMIPLAWLQFWLGSRLWPGGGIDIDTAVRDVRVAGEAWNWLAPLASLQSVAGAVANLSADILGPLAIGVLITGLGAALLAYPLSLIALTYFYAAHVRRRAARGHAPRRGHGDLPLALPGAEESGWTEADWLRRYGTRPQAWLRADSAKLLFDGAQAFPEMLACIERARGSVELETYILRADNAGRRFAAALAGAARRGVRVRLLYDGVGGLGLPQEYVNTLLESGAQVRVFRPFSTLWRVGLGRMNRRDHRKILVVDERVSFTGGMNIANEYAAESEGGGGWRDTHVRVDGEAAARQFLDLFEATWPEADRFVLPLPERAGPAGPALRPSTLAMRWRERTESRSARLRRAVAGEAVHVTHAPLSASVPGATGENTPFPEVSGPPTALNVALQVVNNKEFLERVRVRRTYLHAIRNARRYILIENAYFIPDRMIRAALLQAVKRKVLVAVVVAMYSDVTLAALASRALYGELLAGGVRLFEYPLTMMHSKAAVIDDVWSIVSSYNLDHRSLHHNLEAGVQIMDRRFGQALRDRILQDIAICPEVTPQFHVARRWNEALVEHLAYQVRYWL